MFFIVKHSIAMLKALPDMFPSPVAPAKKWSCASHSWGKRFVHVWEFSCYFIIRQNSGLIVNEAIFLFAPLYRRPKHVSLDELNAKPPAYWPLVPSLYWPSRKRTSMPAWSMLLRDTPLCCRQKLSWTSSTTKTWHLFIKRLWPRGKLFTENVCLQSFSFLVLIAEQCTVDWLIREPLSEVRCFSFLPLLLEVNVCFITLL